MNTDASRQSVVLVTGARAPSALHAARLFHAAGIRVIASDCIPQPLTRADRKLYKTVWHPEPAAYPFAFQKWLTDICKDEAVDLVFPTCEEVFHVADALDGSLLETALFAPYLELLLASHSKVDFASMLGMIDLAAPWTERLRSKDEMHKFGDLNDIVLKPEYSRFATQTLVRPTAEEVSQVTPTQDRPWAVQEALTGPEVCTYCIAVEGEVTAFAAYRPMYRAGRGAGTYFEPVNDPAVKDYVEAFASRTVWTGQFGLDVILTPDRGPVAIECNPRATSGIHFFTNGPDFVDAVTGRGKATSDRHPKMITPVLWTDGLARSIAHNSLPSWWSDIRRASDALSFGSYKAPVCQMARTAAGFALKARRQGTSLLDATTSGIAWDRPPRSRLL